MFSPTEQARANARFFAEFGICLSAAKVERMAFVLARKRASWASEAKRAANIRAKLRARRLAKRHAQ